MTSERFKIDLPFGPPPILPDIGKQFEEYLTKPEKLPLHNGKADFKFWNRKIDFFSLYHAELSPAVTTLKIRRDLNSEESLDFYEVPVVGIGETAKNSTSFSRPPGKITDDVRGSRTNYPFWPGGFDPPTFDENDEVSDFNLDAELLSVAPGLSRGIDFTSLKKKSSNMSTSLDEDTIDFQNIMQDFGLMPTPIANESDNNEMKLLSHELEDKVIPKEVKMPVLNISSSRAKVTAKTEWAEMLNTRDPVPDFKKKIPDPAVEFGFELDIFQKLAILKLEEHKHIFVAAHTSAGKTVVAEYAIGLSQKHCTKTIYTSPIKALSNQKYRDFKTKFTDVGLITGDFQVNQQASCLIMTTEILRSMLYGGSDIVRDIEFVIFDEVHYINDSERGYVWEEILIMLPDTVCIVMLSATVPNVLEFADWVGRTKRAKMYVVSTLKRPVPLQHYLYTGVEGKTDNLFLIMDAEGPFIQEGYTRAVANLQKSQTELKSGKVKTTYLQPLKSEKPYWISFAKFLKKNDKLPVVAFTLSRSKCDRNAELLLSIDLTNQNEKDYINYYFNECIRTLKEEDRNLPQIKRMEILLSRGVAVHHSGILPILKEIVEILFQKSLVKFLFATETFAMGVNMPAKTVAFDSISKYDGTCTRPLQPAEYIQMAGRAGRRGQDDTGTVIILCKHAVENDDKLKSMMKGSPMKLESQFRLTYSMILNLMRVKGMRVEDIMSHSFKESHSRRKLKLYEEELADLETGDETLTKNVFYAKIEDFYEAAAHFVELWDSYSVKLFSNPKIQKELVMGRFIVITYKEHINKLALILHVTSKRDTIEYKVLILRDAETESDSQESELFYRMLGLARKTIYVPNGKCRDMLLTVNTQSIMAITKFHLKIEYDLVLKDCDKRLIPRFKDDQPGSTCQRAISELLDRSYSIQRNGTLTGPNFVSLNEIKINDLQMVEIMAELISSKKKVESFNLEAEISNFEYLFKEVFRVKQREARKKQLKHLLSYKSLQLYPDYQSKINVLRELQYIDKEDIVLMKGKVACEMGSNELIITELIFQNSLSKFEPAEIAALLSCLVFQVKMNDEIEPELTDKLREGIETIKHVQKTINAVERDSVDLNFGLVQVVYEWAHGKPFAEIMNLVEGKVQEGIIVRCIQQLNEILRDIRDAAKLFGDLVLKKKMEEASDAIKRNIVFAASLYTQ